VQPQDRALLALDDLLVVGVDEEASAARSAPAAGSMTCGT
jgi:hypothetical protein